MQRLTIDIGQGYTYSMGDLALSCTITQDNLRRWGRQGICIADANVAALHGAYVRAQLGCWLVDTIAVPAGEGSKTHAMKAKIDLHLLKDQRQRDICIVALGGGMILDLAGFVAATYLRGVHVVYLPTTLLSMVDACIGGKVGINTPMGKNTIGVIRQPQEVVADLSLLKTLPQTDWIAGMAEVLKHAVLADADFLAWLVQHRQAILARHDATVRTMLTRSHHIKTFFVAGDTFDHGLRQCLNYGHTFGHALELASAGHIAHGEAVAHGIWLANRLAVIQGIMTTETAMQIDNAMQQFGLLKPLPAATVQSAETYWALIQQDKKNRQQQCHWLLLHSIGQAMTLQTPPIYAVAYDRWQDAFAAWQHHHVRAVCR